jgi:hypothetical protein
MGAFVEGSEFDDKLAACGDGQLLGILPNTEVDMSPSGVEGFEAGGGATRQSCKACILLLR